MLGKQIIGKSDKANFDSWGLKKIAVKIDTGAYRCSIDCSYVKLQKIGKDKVLHFVLLNEDHPSYNGIVQQTKDFITSKVKSSNGEIEKRYIVKGSIKLFDVNYETEFSLSKRIDMKFPVLIGRKFLNNRFIVDTSRVNLSAKQHKLKEKSNKF